MKKIAVALLVAGAVALGGAISWRLLAGSAKPAPGSAPGEGRLDRPADNLTGLFRSWSLGGQETANGIQDEAILRLGVAKGSRLIGLELRRRRLEDELKAARIRVEEARYSPQWASDEPGPDDFSAGEGETEAYTEESPEATVLPDGTEAIDPNLPAVEETTPEEDAALANLAGLEVEYDKIMAELTPAAMAEERERLAEIAVLSGGSSRGLQTMLARWGLPFAVVGSGGSLPGGKPLLIIPSGGLERRFHGRLAAYTRAGGTVVVFAQRNGSILSALPGRPRGYGWEESESAYEDAVEVAAAHAGAVSCAKPRFSASVDGFFTSLPQGAEVLLRSAQSGQPVAAVYPYGRGTVVATALYTDWAALSRSPGANEYLFLRDLILWALAKGRRLQAEIAEPGAVVKATIPIVNNDPDQMAKKVRVSYLTPEGRLCKPFDLDLRVLPGERVEKTVSVHAPRTPGVWHLVYALVKPDGSLLQSWCDGVDIACGRPAVAAPFKRLGAAVTSADEYLRTNGEIPLALHLWNDGSTAIKVAAKLPGGESTVEVAAGGRKKVILRVPATTQAVALGYYQIDLRWAGGRLSLSRLIKTVPAGARRDAE